MRYEVHVVHDIRIHNVEADSEESARMQVVGALKMFNAQLVVAFGGITLVISGSVMAAVAEKPPFHDRNWKVVQVEAREEPPK